MISSVGGGCMAGRVVESLFVLLLLPTASILYIYYHTYPGGVLTSALTSVLIPIEGQREGDGLQLTAYNAYEFLLYFFGTYQRAWYLHTWYLIFGRETGCHPGS